MYQRRTSLAYLRNARWSDNLNRVRWASDSRQRNLKFRLNLSASHNTHCPSSRYVVSLRGRKWTLLLSSPHHSVRTTVKSIDDRPPASAWIRSVHVRLGPRDTGESASFLKARDWVLTWILRVSCERTVWSNAILATSTSVAMSQQIVLSTLATKLSSFLFFLTLFHC